MIHRQVLELVGSSALVILGLLRHYSLSLTNIIIKIS